MLLFTIGGGGSYTKVAAKSSRTAAHLLNALRSQINTSKFVHEMGMPSQSPSLQQLKEALANTTTQGQCTHNVGRARVSEGGTSASHDLMYWGSVILADTLSIEQETEEIIASIMSPSMFA